MRGSTPLPLVLLLCCAGSVGEVAAPAKPEGWGDWTQRPRWDEIRNFRGCALPLPDELYEATLREEEVDRLAWIALLCREADRAFRRGEFATARALVECALQKEALDEDLKRMLQITHDIEHEGGGPPDSLENPEDVWREAVRRFFDRRERDGN